MGGRCCSLHPLTMCSGSGWAWSQGRRSPGPGVCPLAAGSRALPCSPHPCFCRMQIETMLHPVISMTRPKGPHMVHGFSAGLVRPCPVPHLDGGYLAQDRGGEVGRGTWLAPQGRVLRCLSSVGSWRPVSVGASDGKRGLTWPRHGSHTRQLWVCLFW